MKRLPVNKSHSAKAFNKSSKTVAAANMKATPMRGGWRM